MADTYDMFSQADLSNLYQQAAQPLPEAVTAYAQPAAADYTNLDFYAPTFDFQSYYTPPAGPTGAQSYYSYTPPSTSLADFPAFGASEAKARVSPFVSGGAGGFTPNLYATPAGPPMPTIEEAKQLGTEGAQQPSALQNLLGKVDIGKLLTGGLGGIMSYMAAQRAQEDAARARQEYEAAAQKAAGDVKGLAQPYLTAGGSQLSMALQGALSPAQQQMYQAQQAQLAQAAARTGGVGAIQTAAAEQQMYQQALQNQQNMALQLLGPGNQMAYNAVMTELQGTQGGLQLEMNYGMQAAQAMAGMMQSLGYGVGSTGQQKAST